MKSKTIWIIVIALVVIILIAWFIGIQQNDKKMRVGGDVSPSLPPVIPGGGVPLPKTPPTPPKSICDSMKNQVIGAKGKMDALAIKGKADLSKLQQCLNQYGGSINNPPSQCQSLNSIYQNTTQQYLQAKSTYDNLVSKCNSMGCKC